MLRTALVLAAAAACGPAVAPSPVIAAGLVLPWTAESCRSGIRDRDQDGVEDDCELAVARAFAPDLVVDPRDCLWEAAARPARLGGGYVFAVGPAAGDRDVLRVAFLPAYYRDCGWDGPVCVTRGAGCSEHAGDSEIVVVDARYDATTRRWLTDGVFLSAHCFGRSDGRCRWYRGAELGRFTWADGRHRGAPRIWVARGKHGNYPSAQECDSGHWGYDSCDRNAVSYRFPVASDAQNAGSRHRPLPRATGTSPAGCVRGDRLPLPTTGVDRSAVECFWEPTAPFRGWQRIGVGTAPTAYARVLARAAEF